MADDYPTFLKEFAVVPRTTPSGKPLNERGILETTPQPRPILDNLQATNNGSKHPVIAQIEREVSEELNKPGRPVLYNYPVETYKEREEPLPEPRKEVFPLEITEDIPEGLFFLKSSMGCAEYRPIGYVDERDFLVLFFSLPKDISFIPALGTKMAIGFNESGAQKRYTLYYTSIKFQLPESENVALVFHKIA